MLQYQNGMSASEGNNGSLPGSLSLLPLQFQDMFLSMSQEEEEIPVPAVSHGQLQNGLGSRGDQSSTTALDFKWISIISGARSFVITY